MTRKSSIIVGKLILSAVAVFTGAAPVLADWNSTHIHNPNWPPHAKFHNAQTIVLGAVAAVLAVWFLWRPGRDDRLRADVGSIFSVLYWICLVPSILFPGTAFHDPSHGGYARMPVVLGMELNQAHGGLFFISIVFIANRLVRRAM
ncbi:DUF6640 family protein [Sorangium sp. So ce1128]